MELLDKASGARGAFPTVLASSAFRFGAPDRRLLDVWRELAGAGLHADLVYAPAAWDALLGLPDDGRPLCYVHCGGNAGVATQLTRYRHAGLVDDREMDVVTS